MTILAPGGGSPGLMLVETRLGWGVSGVRRLSDLRVQATPALFLAHRPTETDQESGGAVLVLSVAKR